MDEPTSPGGGLAPEWGLEGKCLRLDKSGRPCDQPPLPGEAFCVWHSESPNAKDRQRNARSSGGKAAGRNKKLENKIAISRLEFKKPGDVRLALRSLTRKLETNAVEPDRGKVLLECIKELAKMATSVSADEIPGAGQNVLVLRGAEGVSETPDGSEAVTMRIPKPPISIYELNGVPEPDQKIEEERLKPDS